MADTILTGVFGTLILAAIGYLVARIDRLTTEVHGHGERLARIEGKLDEHLRTHPAGT